MPVAELYALLSEHENLSKVFAPAVVTRLRDGDTVRNGVGSVRRLKMPVGAPFEETVTQAVENELIEYRITSGSPLKNHLGTMRFSARPGGGSHLDYTIVFEGRVPFIGGLVRLLLDRGIRRGLGAFA
ncbi:MxaD family protein [Zavarzinia compransoris]|uniref:MxaD family protein n=2 Tax=Zavarzinia compransoris TaxID=1264899 RepID=A0A317E1I2_9PROT|nr:MxaD family protein [Zavarzinia compransoris]